MAYADSIRSATATLEGIATLIEGIFSSGYPLTWSSWSPTYGASGSMTFTTVTTNFARYIRVGKLVLFQISATGTTGGTASNYLTATLPVASNGSYNSGLGCIVYPASSSNRCGQCFVNGVSDKLEFYAYDASNYTLGAGAAIIANGFYETE